MSARVQYKRLDFLGFSKYSVGTDGSVWTYRMNRNGFYRWKKKRPSILRKKPYRRVALSQDGRRFYVLVHRLVLMAFVGPCPPGMECCHGDGDPANNRLDNLRWDTPSGNYADRVRHGADRRGTKNTNAKLTEDAVRYIRLRKRSWKGSLRALSRRLSGKYGVCSGTIRSVLVNDKVWPHVVV